MTRRRRPERPESVVARLLRLGILSEVDEATGRRITWSDDFRAVIGGGPDRERRGRLQTAMASDDPATVRAFLAAEAARLRADAARGAPRRQMPRPAPEDLLAQMLMGPPESFAHRQMAVLDFLREVGMVDAIEVDSVTSAIRVELSERYRRLVEAGREPDREPGFDAAWDAGGPAAVREWLEGEAQRLPPAGSVSGHDERSSPTADAGGASSSSEEQALRNLVAVVYGAQAERFMSTPRASLGGRTPLDALADGDLEIVREIMIKDALGDWA